MSKLFAKTDSATIRKTLGLYWSVIKQEKRNFIIYTTLIPLNRLLYMVLLPLLFSLIIQALITQPHNWQTPLMLLGVAAAASIGAVVSAYIGFYVLFRDVERLSTQLTNRAAAALINRSDQFFANRKVGSIAGDVHSFGHSIIEFLNTVFHGGMSVTVNFVASLAVIAILAPILLLPLTVVTGALVWANIRSLNRRATLRFERKHHVSQLNGHVADMFTNQQIVRYFARQDHELAVIDSSRRAIERISIGEARIIQRESSFRQGVLFAFQIMIILLCIMLYTHDLISIAGLIFTITYLGRLTGALFEITPLIRTIEQAFLNAAPITEMLQEPVEVTDQPHASELHVSKGAIELKQIAFSYPGSDQPAINTISLSIPAGQRVGLAGPSGGGKTTLTKLLLRFADLGSGAITIDGQDIASVTQDSLRRAIAYVPQEPLLFHRSLRENIAYGKPDATDEQIYDAIKQANADEFVGTLPQGLDTLVGERGVKLSGGQRQRIAIARAILKDAPILILDEATSALDSASEKLIQEALTRLMKGRTALVVAHRLSTIATLDRIVVIEKGTVKEDGTHSELLERGQIYSQLWQHQSGGFIEQ